METLKAKDKITIFQMNALAMTSKLEVVFDRLTDTHIVFKYPRKRKLYQIKLNSIELMFKGHDLPIKADTDGSCFRGNACYNLVSTLSKEEVIKYIEENNLVELNDKAHMMLMTPEEAENSNSELTIDNCLYPDSGHASSMVQSIRARKS